MKGRHVRSRARSTGAAGRLYIVTDGPFSSGCLKGAKVTAARRVLAVAGAVGWLDWPLADPGNAEPPGIHLSAFLDGIVDADRLQLWFGPHFDAQVGLGAVVDTLTTTYPALAARSVVALLQQDLKYQTPECIRALSPSFVPLSAVQSLAQAVWRAFRAETPAPMAKLLGSDTTALPHLASGVGEWLRELPDVRTGLSATERHILEEVSSETARSGAGGACTAAQVIARVNLHSPFTYWRLGEIFAKMCAAPTPALSGPHDTFSMAMHDSHDRFDAFMYAPLALTAFGEALLAGQEDYLARNPIDRWWGGTHLTSERCWRWDSGSQTLVGPVDVSARR